MSTEIAGLTAAAEPDTLMTPLSAVAVLKGLDTGGQVRYWLLRTEDITLYDAIGMHEGAAFRYKNRLVQ